MKLQVPLSLQSSRSVTGKLESGKPLRGMVTGTTRAEVIIQTRLGQLILPIPSDTFREGEQVTQGQVVAVLEQTASGADVDELSARITSLQFDVMRLEAENRKQETLTFPDELSRKYPDLAMQSLRLFQSRHKL